MNNVILEINDLNRKFGGLIALSSLNFKVFEDRIYTIIGPNGAGKTTLFNLITGFLKPTSGNIIFMKKNITGLPTHQINRLGIARTFQNLRLFKDLSVEENITVAEKHHQGKGPIDRKELLEFLGLHKRSNELAKNLPYGLQRKLEIGRALATRPSLLLLDEPAAGMNPQEVEELAILIKNLKRRHQLTILLIEHQMRLVESISDYVMVLSFGEIIAEGSVEEIQNNPVVIEAYLGGS